MFLASQIAQWAIIFSLIIFFVLVTLLNKNTKAPEGVDIPEECLGCSSTTCIIKTSDIDKIKEDMKILIEENVEACEIEKIEFKETNDEKK